MPNSSPTDPAAESGRRASHATVADSPKSHRVPETDETESRAGSAAQEFPEDPPTKPGWKSRWPTLAALAIAALALAIAVWGWFGSVHRASFSGQQTADAKTNVCAAFQTARQAVVINTHLVNPRGDDQVGTLAVAANARLALLGGGAYLRDRLDAEPATPADLANGVKAVAASIEQLGINYLAGASNSVQDPLRKNLDQQIAQVRKLCA
jgi:hypothetical protein